VEYAANVRKIRNALKILVLKSEGKRTFRKFRLRRIDYINTYLEGTGMRL
jgi:two-component SAPR family response regulator